jgi:hypothetical protein
MGPQFLPASANRGQLARKQSEDAQDKMRSGAKLDADLNKLLGTNLQEGTKGGEYGGVDEEGQAVISKAEAEAKKVQAGINDIVKRSGGSFFSKLIFGEDGPQGTYDQLDEATKHILDNTKAMSDMLDHAGTQMASGIAKAATASIIHGANLKKGLHDQTEAVLESLSTQALSLAAINLAKGLAATADAFMGLPTEAGAAGYYAAAAAFAAVGATAGIAARALGPTSSSASAAGGTATATASGSSLGSSSGGASSGSGTGDATPITMQIYVAPGGEAEAGRSIVNSLNAWAAQTGQDLSHLVNN